MPNCIRQLGQQVLEKSLDHQNAKQGHEKTLPRYGMVMKGGSHRFDQSGNGFKVSPSLQGMILATTAEQPYQIGSELLLSMYLWVAINEMQLYRAVLPTIMKSHYRPH